MDRPLAYVCSPLRGDIETNTQKAQEYCREVYDAGYTPFAPHLLFTQFLDERVPAERESGISMGESMVPQCEVVVVCGDEMTEGMQREVETAKKFGIEVCPLSNLTTAATKEAAFSAYIRNVAEYQQGARVGAWHNFPTTTEAFQKTLKRIGLTDPDPSGYFIDKIQSVSKALQRFLIEDSDIDELNYLAAEVQALTASTLETFDAVIATGRYHSAEDMINVALNIDAFGLRPVYTAEQYGALLAEMQGDEFGGTIDRLKQSADPDLRDLAQYIETLGRYFDSDEYGLETARQEDGIFTSEGYVTVESEIKARYNGLEDIPQERRITQFLEAQPLNLDHEEEPASAAPARQSIREQLAAARANMPDTNSRCDSPKPREPEL